MYLRGDQHLKKVREAHSYRRKVAKVSDHELLILALNQIKFLQERVAKLEADKAEKSCRPSYIN